ncbi:MAG: hypothetical protein RIQ41_486 [Candidatus Parcubacteria bacterium]|jgi:hypothetical protein
MQPEQLQNHYQEIQKAISINISTIKALIKDTDSIKQITAELPEAVSVQKKQVQEEVSKISDSISDLISNTESLFKLYDEFVKVLSK